jgi:hypothetical protein
MARDLLPEHDAASTEGVARRLLWTMDNVLRWNVKHPRSGMHVFRNAEEMAKVWSEQEGEPGGMPRVDYDQQMVVAIIEEEGSYKEIRAIQRVIHSDRGLFILVGKSRRPWSMINPASVIVMPRAEGDPRFLDAESLEAKDILRSMGD